MKGMELSRRYFEEYGRTMIDEKLSRYREYIAAGLVGEGSECFGFDDQLSADHDFGPAFCMKACMRLPGLRYRKRMTVCLRATWGTGG